MIREDEEEPPLQVACGGGLNSWAMMLGMNDRGIRPDLVMFADTGSEKPITYRFLADVVEPWLLRVGWSPLVQVQYGKYTSLEENCLHKKMLPSLAYGYKKCSLKYKKGPQESFTKLWPRAIRAWHRGQKVKKAIGFDADEFHRAKIPSDEKYEYVYPLVEWEWGRDDCLKRAKEEGLPVPAKSSCFFCPASRKSEILELPKDLQERAIALEDNAETKTVVGLGRRFKWRDLIRQDDAQGKLFPEAPEIPCMCFD